MTAKEVMKKQIDNMNLQELTLFYAAALDAGQDAAEQAIAAEANFGRLLKELQDSMTDKEYRSELRKRKIKIKEAREAILIFEHYGNAETE